MVLLLPAPVAAPRRPLLLPPLPPPPSRLRSAVLLPQRGLRHAWPARLSCWLVCTVWW
jgi:hypothetical protein